MCILVCSFFRCGPLSSYADAGSARGAVATKVTRCSRMFPTLRWWRPLAIQLLLTTTEQLPAALLGASCLSCESRYPAGPFTLPSSWPVINWEVLVYWKTLESWAQWCDRSLKITISRPVRLLLLQQQPSLHQGSCQAWDPAQECSRRCYECRSDHCAETQSRYWWPSFRWSSELWLAERIGRKLIIAWGPSYCSLD